MRSTPLLNDHSDVATDIAWFYDFTKSQCLEVQKEA